MKIHNIKAPPTGGFSIGVNMSEEQSQGSCTVKGARTLSHDGTDKMNRLRDISRHFLTLLDTTKETGAVPRWMAMANTEMQKACMSACRTVTLPEDDC
ncbi:DUF7681 family protein [Erwinia pyri]|uniref:Acb2/Tad1 domain-containing protein n=1 Tax=Erwinia pyri TaxID=3062598 RepID=UPI003D179A90